MPWSNGDRQCSNERKLWRPKGKMLLGRRHDHANSNAKMFVGRGPRTRSDRIQMKPQRGRPIWEGRQSEDGRTFITASEHTKRKEKKNSLVHSLIPELGDRCIEWACSWTRRRITRFTVHPGRLGFPLIVRGVSGSTRHSDQLVRTHQTAQSPKPPVRTRTVQSHRNQARRNPTTHMFALPPNIEAAKWWCGFW
jgi:hypothetical protein